MLRGGMRELRRGRNERESARRLGVVKRSLLRPVNVDCSTNQIIWSMKKKLTMRIDCSTPDLFSSFIMIRLFMRFQEQLDLVPPTRHWTITRLKKLRMRFIKNRQRLLGFPTASPGQGKEELM